MNDIAKTIVWVGLIGLMLCSACAAASIDAGAAWLISRQADTGAFEAEHSAATTVQATAEAMLALAAIQKSHHVNLQAALAFIDAASDHETIEILARRIAISAKLGLPPDGRGDRLC